MKNAILIHTSTDLMETFKKPVIFMRDEPSSFLNSNGMSGEKVFQWKNEEANFTAGRKLED